MGCPFEEISLLPPLPNAYGFSGNEEFRDSFRKESENIVDEVHFEKLGKKFFSHNNRKNYPRIMSSDFCLIMPAVFLPVPSELLVSVFELESVFPRSFLVLCIGLPLLL